MALWQKSYFIVPKKSDYYLFENQNLKSFKDDDFFDDELLWNKYNFDVNILKVLESILMKNKSWSNNIFLFGSEESNCIEILVINKEIKSFNLRVDFTTNYQKFLKNFITFCSLNDLVLIDEQLIVLYPNFDDIESNIKNSTSYIKYITFSNNLNNTNEDIN